MLKKSLVWLLCLLFCVSVAFAGGAAEEKKETIVIRLAHEDPPDDQWGQGAIHFKELVEQKSGGEVVIEIYDNGQLGSGVENIEQLQTGSLEMTLGGSDMVLIDPFVKLYDLPYVFRDRDHVDKVLNGPIGDKMAKRLEAHGLVGLAYWENGFRQISNNKRPIYKPEDLKGLKLRVPESDVRIAMFKLYGASPIPMSFSELYGALQQGVIDGQENPYGVIHGDKLYEVQKYVSESNHVYSPITVLIAKAFHDSLPANVQKILKDAARETTSWQVNWAATNEAPMLADIKKAGVQVNKADTQAFIAASKPIWGMVTSELGAEAQAILDEIVNTK